MELSHSVNHASAGVTLGAGTASSMSKIVDYQVQPGHRVLLDRDAVLMLKDNGVTETASRSKIEVRVVSANQKRTETRYEGTYGQVKFNQDTRIQLHPFKTGKFVLSPFARFQVWANSDQTIQTASTDFYLEAKEEA